MGASPHLWAPGWLNVNVEAPPAAPAAPVVPVASEPLPTLTAPLAADPTGGGAAATASLPKELSSTVSVTVGDQCLTLVATTTGNSRTGSVASSASVCIAPDGSVTAAIVATKLRHGTHSHLSLIAMSLDHKQAARAAHLPANLGISLAGLAAGVHTITAQISYVESVAPSARRDTWPKLRRLMSVTRTKELSFTVC
jgi:hypothetical protein